jgi:hypothetical protein
MPSVKKTGHTALLVQVADDVHQRADRRRRVEHLTWGRVISELLLRYAAGADDAHLAAPVRLPRQLAPDSAIHGVPGLNAGYVDPSSITWHRGLPALIRAEAARKGRSIPTDALAGLDDEDGDGDEEDAAAVQHM